MGFYCSWTDPTMGLCYNLNSYAVMGTYYSWSNPKLGSCYNPYLLFSVRLTQCWGSIAVELTPRWGPVTTHIYFSGWQWTQDGVLLQFKWPHNCRTITQHVSIFHLCGFSNCYIRFKNTIIKYQYQLSVSQIIKSIIFCKHSCYQWSPSLSSDWRASKIAERWIMQLGQCQVRLA